MSNNQKDSTWGCLGVFILALFIIGKCNAPDDPKPNPRPQELERSALKYPKFKKYTLNGRAYKVLDFGHIEWLGQNLNLPVGNSFLTEDKRSRLYSHADALKACTAVGWRLPTNDEFLELLEYIAPSTSSDDQGFNKHRAYGAMTAISDGYRFNAQLVGYAYQNTYQNTVMYNGAFKEVRYWTSSFARDYPDQPLYYSVDHDSTSVVSYRTGERIYYMPCRCVRS